MASKSSIFFCITFLSSPFFIPSIKISLADMENLHDTCPTTESSTNEHVFINGLQCKDPKDVSPSDFKSTRLNKAGDTENFLRSSMSIITAAEFPGLNTLGLSVSRTDLEVDGLVATHSHPRASEILFVSKGSVIAGFIDTSNNGFQQVLNEGDVFIVPRGMVHYCFHTGSESSTVFSVLSSQNPGLVSVTDAVPPGPTAEGARTMAMRLAFGLLRT